jgi:hypothetical protein
MAGLTARDIKLFVDAGYHTVERVAFTYVSSLYSAPAAIATASPNPIFFNRTELTHEKITDRSASWSRLKESQSKRLARSWAKVSPYL